MLRKIALKRMMMLLFDLARRGFCGTGEVGDELYCECG